MFLFKKAFLNWSLQGGVKSFTKLLQLLMVFDSFGNFLVAVNISHNILNVPAVTGFIRNEAKFSQNLNLKHILLLLNYNEWRYSHLRFVGSLS